MLAHTLNKMLSSMFRHEQSEDIGALMLPAIGKCAIIPFLTVLQSVSYILSGDSHVTSVRLDDLADKNSMLHFRNYGAEAEEKEEAIPKPPPVGPTNKLGHVKLGLENRMQLSDGEWFVHGLEMIHVEMATYRLGLASHAPYKVIIEPFLKCCCNFIFGKSNLQTEPVIKQMFLIATARLKPDFEHQAECNIGEEGEWNGVVCRHTDTSVAVFCEQGSASSMGHRVKREEAKIT
nr:hypothetical protein [Tanacetum cinerariifolium]